MDIHQTFKEKGYVNASLVAASDNPNQNQSLGQLKTSSNDAQALSTTREAIFKVIFSSRIYKRELLIPLNERFYREMGSRATIPEITSAIVDLVGQEGTSLTEIIKALSVGDKEDLFSQEEMTLLSDLLAGSVIIEEVGHIWAREHQFNLKDMEMPFNASMTIPFDGRKNLETTMNSFLASSISFDENFREKIASTLKQSTRHSLPELEVNAAIEHLRNHKLLSIPAGWAKHATDITLHHSIDGKLYLYYTNRGDKSDDRAIFGDDNTFMVRYEVTRNLVNSNGDLDEDGLKALLIAIHEGLTAEDSSKAQSSIEGKDGLVRELGLMNKIEIGKSPQKVGNCAIANAKGGIHATMIAIEWDKRHSEGIRGEKLWKMSLKDGTKIFKEFEFHAKHTGLKKIIAICDFDQCTLSSNERFKLISLISSKLINPYSYARYLEKSVKYGEDSDAFANSAIAGDINVMKKDIEEYLHRSKLPIHSCCEEVKAFMGDVNFALQLKKSELGAYPDGAFMLLNVEGKKILFANRDGQIERIKIADDISTLAELTNRYSFAKYPVHT